MKNAIFCFFLILGSLFNSVLFAQTPTNNQSSTGATQSKDDDVGTDLYVGRRLQPLWNLVSAPSRDTKEVILRGFESGKIALDPVGVVLLTRLAGAGAYYIDFTPGGLTDIRIRALSVLGTAGAEGAKGIEKVLSAEWDPNAMAIAFYYLGQAGPSSDHRLVVMCKAILRDALGVRSTTAVSMYLDAMRKLVAPSAAADDNPTYAYVLDVMAMVVDAGYPMEIRNQAIDILSIISGVPS